MPAERDDVVPMSRLEDFRVADGDPDVRGWEVRGAGGEALGRVADLLVDTREMKVRYLELEVDPELIPGERRVLVPIGYARMEDDRDCVCVDGFLADELRSGAAPDAEPGQPGAAPFSHGRFLEAVRADLAADARDRKREDFHGAPEFDPERFYASRRRRTVDPLSAARWEQVRGDEVGIRDGGTTETFPRVAGPDASEDRPPWFPPGGITEGMGDPGGER